MSKKSAKKAELRVNEPSRWDDVRVFLAAVRTGSFTLAARALDTEQSTVSRRIAQLERDLGAALFERTPRGPLLSELGSRLYEDAERVEAEVHRLADAASNAERTVRGRVRVATTESLATQFLMPRVLPVLRREYPELAIDVLTSDRAVDLSAREADLAVRFFRGGKGDLIGRRVARLPTGVLATRALARKLRAARVDSASLPWIAVEVPGLATPEMESLRARRGAPKLVCSSYEVQLAGIRAGLGVGFAPRALLDGHPELTELTAEAPGPTLELFVVTRRAIRALPRIGAVFDLLARELAALDEGRPVRQSTTPTR